MARIHRSAAQWQYFIELWQASGQSAAQFCKTHDLGYVSFCKWRQRLEANEQQHSPTQFIDLSTLTLPRGAACWSIVLSLGNGVELKLNQL
jgi:hypothetical protein